MTAVAMSTNGWSPEGSITQLPPGQTAPLQAGATAGQGQAVYYDANGNVALNDGTVPALVCAGVVFPDKLVGSTTAVAGQRSTMLHEGYGGGQLASTATGDGFTASDVATPAFEAGNGTPGKLSNSSGNDRSFMGIVLGLFDNGAPRIWAGRVASIVARALHWMNNEAAVFALTADTGASAPHVRFVQTFRGVRASKPTCGRGTSKSRQRIVSNSEPSSRAAEPVRLTFGGCG